VNESNETREELKTQAVVLYLQGWPVTRIAQQTGLPHPTVSRTLDAVRNVWKAGVERDRLERVAEGLAKLDLLEATAWANGALPLVLRCIDIRFRVLGAYKPTSVVVSTVPWDAIALGTDDDPIERRLAAEGGDA
jgi:hypothetical protein